MTRYRSGSMTDRPLAPLTRDEGEEPVGATPSGDGEG